MLRITRFAKDGTTWLRLEGKLMGPWVEHVRTTVDQETARCNCIHFDLSELTFVDAAGLLLLRELSSCGHDLSLRSNFVTELLRAEIHP
ncbi:MAG: hypothetical protein HZA51_14910 [Planctomycetes bacterium]|nr:hypothetical protein [Planctomycetota bacterium]